jgi:hypothetical protein
MILNEDRHFRNICMLRSNNNNVRMAPIFDNGLSLLSKTELYGYMGFKQAVRVAACLPFGKLPYEALVKLLGKKLLIDLVKLEKAMNEPVEPYPPPLVSSMRRTLFSCLRTTRDCLWEPLDGRAKLF